MEYTGFKREFELKKTHSYHDAIKFIDIEWKTTYEDLQREADYKFNYYNAKQNTLKIFMNTFYGQLGSPTSPYFIAALSGAVTKLGRRNLKLAKKFIEGEGCEIVYGDTDSLYVIAPKTEFAAADNAYACGTLTKEKYYEELVGITMNYQNALIPKINAFYRDVTKSPFLNMAYEEVLFPFALFGKKNYAGIKHIDSIDFSSCRGDVPMKMFLRGLFSRGIAPRRRDGTEFMKEQLNKIIKAWFCLDEKRTPQQIIFDVMTEAFIEIDKLSHSINKTDGAFIEFRNMMFPKIVKNVLFKKTESVTTLQHTFKQRMKNYTIYGLKEPQYGERHDLIYCKNKKNKNFTIKGTNNASTKGDTVEYLEIFTKNNEAYIKDNDIELDTNYYKKEIINKISLFLLMEQENKDKEQIAILDMSKKLNIRVEDLDKKDLKNATMRVVREIAKELGAKYYYHEKIDKQNLKNQFDEIYKPILQKCINVKFIKIIFDYFIISKITIQKTLESIAAIFGEKKYIIKKMATVTHRMYKHGFPQYREIISDYYNKIKLFLTNNDKLFNYELEENFISEILQLDKEFLYIMNLQMWINTVNSYNPFEIIINNVEPVHDDEIYNIFCNNN
jgi:hypothetical protein